MLFDLTFPCYLTTFSGKKCLSGKVICAFSCPAYRSSPVFIPSFLLTNQPTLITFSVPLQIRGATARRYLTVTRMQNAAQDAEQEPPVWVSLLPITLCPPISGGGQSWS
jgi:hypothetical protein